MPRNLIFLLDVSENMGYNNGERLVKAKRALHSFIETLAPEDTFAIQTFGPRGTETLWGPLPGTIEEKSDAIKFLNATRPSNRWGTDLNEAFLEGILRAISDAEASEDNHPTILVCLSGNSGSKGETNRTKIVQHVSDLNQDGLVKIFNLGVGVSSSHMQLLDTISLINGGVSAPIRARSHDDFDLQIVNFLKSEIGEVLMSDVEVKYSTGINKKSSVYGETQTVFPVMADGYEVVVRGLILETDADKKLNAITSASTMNGPKTWELPLVPTTDNAARSSLCFQSYAHDRITQLLRLSDSADLLGDDLLKRLVTLKKPCTEDEFAKCVRAEALDLALEANVVAKGLTAMVTVDMDKCMKRNENAQICLDGTTPDEDAERPKQEDPMTLEEWPGKSGDVVTAESDSEPDYRYQPSMAASDMASAGATPAHQGLITFAFLFFSWFFFAVLNM